MTLARKFGAAALVSGFLALSACGGMGKDAAPAQSPPAGGAAPEDESRESGTDSEKKLEETERGESFAQPPPPGGGGTPALGGEQQQPERTITTVAEAQAAFERDYTAISTALASGKDCDRACKAFGSMGRSSQRICELNGPADPDDRCKKAKERVDVARAKLQRVCGGCAE